MEDVSTCTNCGKCNFPDKFAIYAGICNQCKNDRDCESAASVTPSQSLSFISENPVGYLFVYLMKHESHLPLYTVVVDAMFGGNRCVNVTLKLNGIVVSATNERDNEDKCAQEMLSQLVEKKIKFPRVDLNAKNIKSEISLYNKDISILRSFQSKLHMSTFEILMKHYLDKLESCLKFKINLEKSLSTQLIELRHPLCPEHISHFVWSSIMDLRKDTIKELEVPILRDLHDLLFDN